MEKKVYIVTTVKKLLMIIGIINMLAKMLKNPNLAEAYG